MVSRLLFCPTLALFSDMASETLKRKAWFITPINIPKIRFHVFLLIKSANSFNTQNIAIYPSCQYNFTQESLPSSCFLFLLLLRPSIRMRQVLLWATFNTCCKQQEHHKQPVTIEFDMKVPWHISEKFKVTPTKQKLDYTAQNHHALNWSELLN